MKYLLIAVLFISKIAYSQTLEGGNGGGSVGGGGGAPSPPYEATGTAASVSIPAATHLKGVKPDWGPHSCINASTGIGIPLTNYSIDPVTGDVAAVFSGGSVNYLCRVFSSGSPGPTGPQGAAGSQGIQGVGCWWSRSQGRSPESSS
jgi:hypothetical protein